MKRTENVAPRAKAFLKQNWLILLLFWILFTRFGDHSAIPIARKNLISTPSAMAATSDVGSFSLRADKNSIQADAGVKTEAKISKNLNINIEVRNAKDVKGDLEEYVNSAGGFVDNFYSYEFYNRTAYNFYIRIPAGKLDEFSRYIKGKGTLKSENFSSSDRTNSYVDNTNRLKNLQIRRDSLRKLMREEVKQVADVISLEKELNNVQTEIERFEKNNQKIQDSVDYSSVNLTLTPRVILDARGNGWDFDKSVGNALNTFIRFCQKFVDWLLTLLVFTPIILVLFVAYRIFCRKTEID
jgi:hypothetical protein